MPSITNAVSEKKAKTALTNPRLRKFLTTSPMFECIKEETGLDVREYDSLKDYFFAYYSTIDTEVLEAYSRASAGDPNETLEEVLRSRATDAIGIQKG